MSSNNPIDVKNPIGKLLTKTSRLFALSGGLFLLGILFLTLANVVGRRFGIPIPGDFEITELGMAIAIFLFLPFCQIRKGNISIDTFTKNLRPSIQSVLDAVGATAYALISGLITWRLLFGGIDFFRFDDQTMVLGIPRFIAFIPITISALLLTLICIYTTWQNLILTDNE